MTGFAYARLWLQTLPTYTDRSGHRSIRARPGFREPSGKTYSWSMSAANSPVPPATPTASSAVPKPRRSECRTQALIDEGLATLTIHRIARALVLLENNGAVPLAEPPSTHGRGQHQSGP